MSHASQSLHSVHLLGAAAIMHDFQSIEAELVECMSLWRRTPGGVGPAMKQSGIWRELLRTAEDRDYDARGGDLEAPALRPLPLSKAEVARRDAVSAWVEHVPDAANRRLVGLVVAQLAAGKSEDQISWTRILRQLGQRRGAGGLRQRYASSIHLICVAVNAAAARAAQNAAL